MQDAELQDARKRQRQSKEQEEDKSEEDGEMDAGVCMPLVKTMLVLQCTAVVTMSPAQLPCVDYLRHTLQSVTNLFLKNTPSA